MASVETGCPFVLVEQNEKKTGGQIDAESCREFLLGFPEFRWDFFFCE